jgi:NADH-quinone oxidoreductase subunit M
VIIIVLGVYPMPVMGLMTTSINKLVEVLSPVMMTALH